MDSEEEIQGNPEIKTKTKTGISGGGLFDTSPTLMPMPLGCLQKHGCIYKRVKTSILSASRAGRPA